MDNNTQALQLRERSTGLIAIAKDLDKSREFERGLTVQKIIKDSVPISILKKNVPFREIAQALDIQLTRFVASLNLKHTLNDHQIKTLVEDLIDKYPNESLEDFILVFKKARTGEFKNERGDSTIYNLDSSVIFKWMEMYFDEKYRAIEDELYKSKDEYKNKVYSSRSNSDWFKLWEEAIKITDQDKTDKKPNTRIDLLRNQLNALTDKEVREEGQVSPKRQHYPKTPEPIVIQKQRHIEYLRENYDKYTGKPLSDWMPEDEWIKMKSTLKSTQ